MAVIVGVMLAGLFSVILRVDVMALRHVRVMTGRLVVSTLMMVGGRLMMPGSMLVMFGGFAMMLGSLLRHELPPLRIISRLSCNDITAA